MSTVRRPLDRDQVVAAAVAFADEHGLEATTMRRLAQAIGVTPMALYKHVSHREQLIDEMVDRIVRDIPPIAAGDGEGDWTAAVRARILRARRALMSHPWAQDAIETRTVASSEVLRYMDGLMRTMFDGGLSADLVHHGMHALSTRMWGFTRDVMPMPSPPEGADARAAAIADFFATYPAIGRMATTAPHAGEGCDDDAEFDFALDLLLAGLQRRHADGWTSQPG